MSLRTKFIISVTILLFLLVGLILFVIERREERAIFEEHKEKGVLVAKNIAYLNLEPLIFWDVEGIEKSIQEKTDQNLLYVAFFDRYSRPLVASGLAENHPSISQHSHLKGQVEEESYYFQTKKIEEEKTGQFVSVLEIETPIFARGSPIKWGSIKIGLSLEDMQKEIAQTQFMLIVIGLGGLLVGIGGAVFLSNQITGPLKKLVDGTVKVSQGDFSPTINVHSQDEVGSLARSFNQMSRQLKLTRERMERAKEKLIQAEKLASIGRISASIAHEIRNPLTSAKLNIQKVLQSDHIEETEREHLSLSQEGIQHIEKFIQELLDFTRISGMNPEKFSIQEIMDESIKMISDSMEAKKINLQRNYHPGLPWLWVDADKIRQVFLNLLRNACEAVEEGGNIKISLSLSGGEEKVKIEIADDGYGISGEDREAIFEPFYTTKSSGTGLGLANARKIIEQHGGSIGVKKGIKGGSCFEIILPVKENKNEIGSHHR